ncbi:MAG TPA: hypothetical protein VNE38_11620 [Ktedonobacteraceae bacterium]|nr:hypothetical protein [Ktedonobacteraceae bacterium]
MGCIKRLIQLLVLAVVVIVALALFLPQFLAQAGNSLISNVNSKIPSISGLVQYIPSNFTGKSNALQITLSGLFASTKYYVTLDPNTCGSPGYQDVGPITADSNGNISATLNLNALDTSQNWYVDIHDGSDASGPTVACSQLNINNTSVTIEATNTTIQLSPTASTSNNVQGLPNTGVTPTTPHGFPNTGVAPGSNNSYDNNVYPRKY